MQTKNTIRAFKVAASLALLCLAMVGAAQAQTMSSTQELKLACETSPNNIVVLTNNTQISTGPQAPLTETVLTKCTIVLNPQITFAASQVSMTFNGPLSIQTNGEGHVNLIESSFTAPAVSVALNNLGSLLVERSLLRSSVNNIAITSGVESIVDIRGPLAGGGLVSNRSINITGGSKFLGTLTDAEVRAGAVISVNMSGNEAQFIATNSTMNTNGGAININGTGLKNFVEFKLGAVATGRNGVNVTLGGESVINGSQFTFNSPAGRVLLTAGGSKSEITLASGTIGSGTVTTIQSSLLGTEGKAILQNATVNATGNFRLETGSLGNSEVVDSSLTSGTLVRIVSGAGGSCKSQNNIINAPTQQICQ